MFSPPLTQDDLDAAGTYAAENPDEIERALWLNGAAASVGLGRSAPSTHPTRRLRV
jgi:hypothetical protein